MYSATQGSGFAPHACSVGLSEFRNHPRRPTGLSGINVAELESENVYEAA